MKIIDYNSPIARPKRVRFLLFFPLMAFLWACAQTPPVPTEEVFINKRNIGEAYIMNGNFTSALSELLEAEKINPKDPVTQNYLGIAYMNKDMEEQGITHFQKAIELNPGYSQARNNLGAAYLETEKWDLAIQCFMEVIDDVLYTTPQYPLANLGKAYYQKKNYHLAETYYKKALDKQPNMLIALDGLGATLMEKKEYVGAIEIYKKALQYDNRNPLLHYTLAKAYELSANYNDAFEEYRKVMDLSPENNLGKEAEEAARRLQKFR
jgi:tetratricopeptide (TPR) repeat protein